MSAAQVAKPFVKAPAYQGKHAKPQPFNKQNQKVQYSKAAIPAQQPTAMSSIQKGIDYYSSLYKQAEILMKAKEDEYYQKLQSDKDAQFYLNMLKQGTVGDKISALSMIIQRNNQHSLSYLNTLLSLAKKKNKKQAELAIGALRDLFTDYLLTDNQKLFAFSKNPSLVNLSSKDPKQQEKELILAFYQHQLKEHYHDFITKTLKELTHDDLEFYRKYALNILELLLEKKPEQEDVILNIIVNKLGDLSKKVQCHTIYLLLKLTQTHKEMAEVIVREVNQFISRPGTKNVHIYYAVAYLNRAASIAAPKDEKVRLMLFRIFFNLFQKVLKQDQTQKIEPVKKDRTKSKDQQKKFSKNKPAELDQQDNKVAELVLKGVNILMAKCPSFQHNEELRKLIDEETNVIFKLTHHEVFRIQIQALKLLFQFTKTSKKHKQNEIEIAKEQTTVDSFSDRYYRSLYEVLLRIHLNKAAKLDELFSLLFKSIKSDTNNLRVQAFVRRIIQMSSFNEASFTAACLLIISELIKVKDDLKFQLYSFSQITSSTKPCKNSKKRNVDSDDEEERFYDADKLEEQMQIIQNEKLKPSNGGGQISQQYDPLKREPKFANSENTPIYELITLTLHTHPSVRLWATKLIEGESIEYNGDPLLDFGVANFLDRISYKNPKSLDKIAKFNNKRMAATEKPINLYEFSGNGNENDVPQQKREEEEYLYKFFKLKGPKKLKSGKDKLDDEEDEDDEVEDQELEAFADQVIEKEMKRLAGGKVDELEEEDEDVLDELEGEEDEDMSDEDKSEEFFQGEDLSEVDVNEDEKSGEEDGEEGEKDEEDADEYGDEYGGELDDEDDEEGDEEDNDDVFTKSSSNKSNKKKKEQKTSSFADYDEFAHLLEADLYDEQKAKQYLPKYTGSKRPRGGKGNGKGNHKRGGGGSKRPRNK